MTWERVDPETLDLENHRRELVMVEEVLRQTAEYWEEVRRQFELDDNLTRNRYLYRAPSGGLYDIVFVGRTDEPFPSGMEFWYLADGFDQLPPRSTINADLWDLVRDLVAGVEERYPDVASLEVFERQMSALVRRAGDQFYDLLRDDSAL